MRQTRSPALRVLLVENDPDTQEVFRLFLAQCGHDVHATTTVAGALAAMAESCFDVLLADIGLNDGTGWDLMQEADRRGLHRPGYAIAMSGYGMAADRARSFAAGFDQHLVKPVDLEAIEGQLRLASAKGAPPGSRMK